jgi:hypothetical protein
METAYDAAILMGCGEGMPLICSMKEHLKGLKGNDPFEMLLLVQACPEIHFSARAPG